MLEHSKTSSFCITTSILETYHFSGAKKARGRPRGSVNKPRQMVKMEPQDDRFFEEFFIDAPPLQSMSSNEEPTSSNKESNECTPFNDILNCLQNGKLFDITFITNLFLFQIL